MLAQNDFVAFCGLLTGAKEFYGVTEVGEIVNGKAESKSYAIHQPPSPSIYANHLNGKASIGISPLKADDTVIFGAIDIDNYSGNLNDVISAIYYYDFPCCPCYSKSKHLHLYFFFENGTLAADATELMRWYARALACEKKVEIFPKQVARTGSNKAYSWINLPYFEADNAENHRKMIKEDFTLAPLSDFIERAKQFKWSIAQHKDKIKTIPCYDAPPCILTGVILRDVGQGGRNAWLFSVAVYLRLKDSSADLETELTTINESLKDPLPDEELHKTILKSLERKSYFYLCNQLNRCDKAQCYKLDHGIGSKQASGLTYGSLRQYMTDPPTYKWDINGQDMDFESEADLLTQSRFRQLCLRFLHRVPRTVDDATWSRILTKASENIQVIYPEAKGGDFTVGSQLYDYLCMFFSEKRNAKNISQVYLGRVWIDDARKEYVFTANCLMTFIRDTKGFKALGALEIKHRLEEMGAYKEGNLWHLPTAVFPEEDLNRSKRVEIDLSLHEGESNDF
jgi:hypothetical protein